MDLVERYLELGVRLGRRVEGLVDASLGPAATSVAGCDDRLGAC